MDESQGPKSKQFLLANRPTERTTIIVSFKETNQNSCGSSTKSATDMSDTLPADLCMRMVGGRVREILDLLALSGNEIGCAEAHRLQKLFKSVIHALDDLQSACCGSPQINTLRNSCKKTVRLSGAGSETSLSNEVLQCKHPRNVCNQCTGLVNTNLKTLIKAAANFGCLYGYAVNSNIVKRR
ncbi:hypothetical protein AGLY_004099 [Aphis glycines]|uniref:Uncharacterized protein n=1 Tax=Aphis glycines TaxID=307491 RepID=A0A6G0TXL7_APHGL|nr:hypothetical protein AGLY_004099 [Aphis glycines]